MSRGGQGEQDEQSIDDVEALHWELRLDFGLVRALTKATNQRAITLTLLVMETHYRLQSGGGTTYGGKYYTKPYTYTELASSMPTCSERSLRRAVVRGREIGILETKRAEVSVVVLYPLECNALLGAGQGIGARSNRNLCSVAYASASTYRHAWQPVDYSITLSAARTRNLDLDSPARVAASSMMVKA